MVASLISNNDLFIHLKRIGLNIDISWCKILYSYCKLIHIKMNKRYSIGYLLAVNGLSIIRIYPILSMYNLSVSLMKYEE